MNTIKAEIEKIRPDFEVVDFEGRENELYIIFNCPNFLKKKYLSGKEDKSILVLGELDMYQKRKFPDRLFSSPKNFVIDVLSHLTFPAPSGLWYCSAADFGYFDIFAPLCPASGKHLYEIILDLYDHGYPEHAEKLIGNDRYVISRLNNLLWKEKIHHQKTLGEFNNNHINDFRRYYYFHDQHYNNLIRIETLIEKIWKHRDEQYVYENSSSGKSAAEKTKEKILKFLDDLNEPDFKDSILPKLRWTFES